MLWLTIFLLAAALVGLAVREIRAHRARNRAPAHIPGQYVLAPSLFTKLERLFYEVLVGLELPEIRVLAKVRLADLFRVRPQSTILGWWDNPGAIDQFCVDFLLVRSDDCRPVLGITLEDSSDQNPDKVAREGFVRAVFSDCGLPLLNLPAKHVYTAAAVRRLIYDVTPLNFPLSGLVETMTNDLHPGAKGAGVRQRAQSNPA